MLKVKNFPNTDFLNSNLKHGSSYTWKSIWLVRKVIQDGFSWRGDSDVNISIFNHAWILGSINHKLAEPIYNCNLELVTELIDANVRKWKQELITSVLLLLIWRRFYAFRWLKSHMTMSWFEEERLE